MTKRNWKPFVIHWTFEQIIGSDCSMAGLTSDRVCYGEFSSIGERSFSAQLAPSHICNLFSSLSENSFPWKEKDSKGRSGEGGLWLTFKVSEGLFRKVHFRRSFQNYVCMYKTLETQISEDILGSGSLSYIFRCVWLLIFKRLLTSFIQILLY